MVGLIHTLDHYSQQGEAAVETLKNPFIMM